jgi:pepF/M3 family oligoendopeptidase
MPDLGAIPRWDVTGIFPSLESPEFEATIVRARVAVQALATFWDAHEVRRRGDIALSPGDVATFEEATGRLNTVLQELRTLRSYVNAFLSTNAADETAQARMSELQMIFVALEPLRVRYAAWVGTRDVEALLAASQVARDHEYIVRKSQIQARHQMEEGEEALAAELLPAGLTGWVRLHDDLSALLQVTLTLRGKEQTLPMSSVRALANDPDRAVRRAAYEAELRAWETVAVPMAAALNGVKGYQQTVRRRRGYADDVAPTLIANAIDADTLAAMQEACVASFPDFRRYLRAKARALGLERLAWFDINAPVGGAARRYTWPEAETFLLEQFGHYSERLASFAARTFRDAWIDAEPRAGKQGGGFCMQVRPGESRILMNFDGSFNAVGTLAHELGHAYHNLNLETRTFLQAVTPSTLGETASIFCETLAFDAALSRADGEERLSLLEASLQRDLMVVVDIHSRFLFEQEVFARRARRELRPREFSDLMLDAQRQTYGDGLDGAYLHPYMWQVKGHYYGPTFYNYPYTFGLLFGLGLYARYRQDPDAFRAGYDDLLSSTGLADAATLAARCGIDTRSAAFWMSSLDVIRRKIDEFERLTTFSGKIHHPLR